MKNYYKILQVDKDASPEIIKVAYKLLVKKNHPDLKEGEDKKNAEEKIKEINEAYDVLSNPTKKAEYDQTLTIETISSEQYEAIIAENQNLKNELSYYKFYYNRTNCTQMKYRNMYADNISKDSNNKQKTINLNINTNKSYFKEKLKTLIAIIITFVIIFIFFNIPFINQYISNLFDGKFLFFIVILIFFYYYFFKNIE